MDWSTAIPQAKDVEAPRRELALVIRLVLILQCWCYALISAAHVDDIPPWFGPNTYRAISIGMLILLAVGILAIVGGVAFLQAKNKRKKHFF